MVKKRYLLSIYLGSRQDDLARGVHGLGGEGDPRGHSSSRDGHHDGVQTRDLLVQLEGDGALAGDHVNVVVGVHDFKAGVLVGDPLARLLPRSGRDLALHQLGPVPFNRRALKRGKFLFCAIFV